VSRVGDNLSRTGSQPLGPKLGARIASMTCQRKAIKIHRLQERGSVKVKIDPAVGVRPAVTLGARCGLAVEG